MESEIRDLSKSNLNDIPGICRRCTYWSFPEVFDNLKTDERNWEVLEAKKKQWILETLRAFGNSGKILYYDDIPVGYAEYGPSNRFLNIKAYNLQPVGSIEDGVVFISCLYIADRNLRGKGMGRLLLNSIIEELRRRGYKAMETYALKDSPNNPSGPVDFYLKNGFYVKNENNPHFSIMRLDLFVPDRAGKGD